MPGLKCPQCARELPASASVCPYDGTELDSSFGGPVPARWDEGAAPTSPQPVLAEPEDPGANQPLRPGHKLGDYVVHQLLGSGGMGEVYSGEQPMIGKKVAIKVLKSRTAADPVNVQRMLSEARAVNAIRHRSIVDIFNFGTLVDGRPYLVMEYLEGTALDVMIRKEGPLVPADVAEFLEETCSALSAAHARGIVHRDLKPGNVFIVGDKSSRNRYVKLLDFGLAKGEASGPITKQTQPGMVVGTPDYMAPEQARGGTVTPRADLYALGVMAFEMLTGALPFAASSVVELMMMHVQTPAPRVRSKVDFCPLALDALVHQLMAKAAEDRPSSAELVRQELSRIRRDLHKSTTIAASTAAVSAQTIRIGLPEASTPAALAFADPDSDTVDAIPRPPPGTFPPLPPRPSVPRPRLSAPRLSAPRVAAAANVEAARAEVPSAEATLDWREPDPAYKRIGVILALLALGGAGGYWLYKQRPQRPVDKVVLVPPPPPSIERRLDAPPPIPIQPRPAPAAAGPTPDELRAELARLLLRLEKVEKRSPAMLRKVNERWSDRISEATTVEARREIQRELAQTP